MLRCATKVDDACYGEKTVRAAPIEVTILSNDLRFVLPPILIYANQPISLGANLIKDLFGPDVERNGER
jgi:hypothetical protein